MFNFCPRASRKKTIRGSLRKDNEKMVFCLRHVETGTIRDSRKTWKILLSQPINTLLIGCQTVAVQKL